MEKSGGEAKKPEIPPLQEKRGGEELSAAVSGLTDLDNLQVSNFQANVENLKQYLRQKVRGFQAGKISKSYSMWQELTSDPEILNTVNGQNIEFTRTPWQNRVPTQKAFIVEETKIIEAEIKTLLLKGVIRPAPHEPGEFISTIFLRPKPDGTHRMILNLKKLNESVVYHPF